MTKEEAIGRLRQILDGIDTTVTTTDEGWWETSTGATFGAGKLAEVEQLIEQVYDERSS